jgi:TetR/AcrR family transcriptional repressor of mexCD-oprJ operon
MPVQPVRETQQAIAARNLDAILDGAQRLLERREQPTISAVAAEAGVSRPTVYAHFPDRRRLLEALVQRAVERTMAAVRSAEPDRGPADDALLRVLTASWEHLGRNEDIARAAAAELSPDAMRRAHETARGAIRALAERGRREGAFRTDLTPGWLVTSCLALIHAAAEEVRAGQLESTAALETLLLTVAELFTGPRGKA